MKKLFSLSVSLLLVVSLAYMSACAKKGDPLVGTWEMVGQPGKTIKITKEGNNYFYEGSQGKNPATKVDENTLKVSMMGIDVTIHLDPATNILSVSFMSEVYKYKKVQ